MSNRTPWFATTILAFLVIGPCAFGQGTILWDESVNGPLSQDFTAPTSLTPLQMGTNTILGMTEVERTGNNWAGHPDFFTFSVPGDSLISAIYLQIDKPNVWTWIGDPGFGSQLAFTLDSSTGNLLSQWTLASVANGAHGMYIDNHDHSADLSIASYRLDFFVQSIPEPGTFSLLLVGLGLVGVRRWTTQTKQK